MRKLTGPELQKLAQDLVGTCDSFEDGIRYGFPDEDVDSDDALSRIEQEGDIFLCEQCGWWCEMSEMHSVDDSQLCDDCHSERDDDE